MVMGKKFKLLIAFEMSLIQEILQQLMGDQ